MIFSIVENGYDPKEVDRYIEMLQQEYNNAVEWGSQLEAKLEEIRTDMEQDGFYLTIDENNQDEVIASVFQRLNDSVNRVREDAKKQADDIVERANERSHAIVKKAMENSVELRSQNDIVMKNLKSISDMIRVILEKTSS